MIEKIFYNGNILTQDISKPAASAFAISQGKIVAVGRDEEILSLQTTQSQVSDLKLQTVLPGFNDAHIHLWKVGNLMTYLLDLRGVRSIGEMQQKLLDYARKNPELDWIQARGFNEALFPDKRMPTKHDLDEVISDRPVSVIRVCAHQVIANAKALEAAGISNYTVAPQGGEIKKFNNGELKGHFTETAIGLVLGKIRSYTPAEYREMILAAQGELLKAGITSATDPAVMPDLLEVYKSMDRNGELKIRVNAIAIRLPDGAKQALPLPEKYSSPHLKIDTVKFFADGGLSGKTAAMYQPYKNSEEKGVLRLEKSFFKKLAAEAQEAGFRIATHAIGDVAMDLVCEVYEELWNEFHMEKNRIEHVGFPSQKNLEFMHRAQVSAVMQPVFIRELGRNFRDYLEEERLSKVYPIHSVLHAGINLAFSTDAPVVNDFNPICGIQCAMQRRDAEGNEIGGLEKVSFEDSLNAYTMGSAIANDDESNRGSISSGKWADFVLLEQKPETWQKNVKDVNPVSETYCNGERNQSKNSF
ncbi:MAG: amidohydrolase [Chitinophagales bacterium]|nr:amidohydrolase [Chitinophagales bacterium]